MGKIKAIDSDPINTYTFCFKTETSFSLLADGPHVARRRIFSKTLSREKIWEKTALWLATHGQTKMEIFKFDHPIKNKLGRSPSPGPPLVPWALPLTGSTPSPLGAKWLEGNLPCLYVPSSFFTTFVVWWLKCFLNVRFSLDIYITRFWNANIFFKDCF